MRALKFKKKNTESQSNDIKLLGNGVESALEACCNILHHFSASILVPALNLYTLPEN